MLVAPASYHRQSQLLPSVVLPPLLALASLFLPSRSFFWLSLQSCLPSVLSPVAPSRYYYKGRTCHFMSLIVPSFAGCTFLGWSCLPWLVVPSLAGRICLLLDCAFHSRSVEVALAPTVDCGSFIPSLLRCSRGAPSTLPIDRIESGRACLLSYLGPWHRRSRLPAQP